MRKSLLSVLFFIIFIAGCSTVVCEKTPPLPPPAPRVEIYGTPPSARAVWISGYWSWKGPRRGYIWIPGYWKKN